jgi:RNA-directed DNA polymerase
MSDSLFCSSVSSAAISQLPPRPIASSRANHYDGKGNKRTTTANKDSGKGTPQGAPISPLLANLYMRRCLLGWKQAGWDRKLKAHIVNYADDFVILCRATAQKARAAMEAMMGKLKSN